MAGVSENGGGDFPGTAADEQVVPPPRKISRPKMTLKMPQMSPQLPQIYSTPVFLKNPLTPATAAVLPNYRIGATGVAYTDKTREFVFKQFKGFRDFTKNEVLLGLSSGEKLVFWLYGKLCLLSRNTFTHIFLFLIVCVYCVVGGFMFYNFESGHELKVVDAFKMQLENQTKRAVDRIYQDYRNDVRKIETNEKDYVDFRNATEEAIQDLVNFLKNNSGELNHYAHAPGWTIITAIYFCGTVFTTIVEEMKMEEKRTELDEEKKLKKEEIILKEEGKEILTSGIWEEIVREWRQFGAEHGRNLSQMRHLRNRCCVGFLIMFVFCGLGAMGFHSAEGAFEQYYKCGVKRVKRDFLDTLWSMRHSREEEWKSLARGKLMQFENQLYDAYESGMNSYSGQKKWSFLNSFVYCLTIVTTIGYGHLAPVTSIGRVMTIIYSLIGIPLFLILLADYGKLFTRGMKYIWAFVRRLYYTGSCRKVRSAVPVQGMVKGVQFMYDMSMVNFRRSDEESQSDAATAGMGDGTPALSSYTIDDEFNLPIWLAFAILIIYMLGGAYFFYFTEGWSIFEAFYFVYVSISTIGFGDLVPRTQIYFMLLSLVYFIFGLSLTSMCYNVVMEELSDLFEKASTKIGSQMGLETVEICPAEEKTEIPTEEEIREKTPPKPSVSTKKRAPSPPPNNK